MAGKNARRERRLRERERLLAARMDRPRERAATQTPSRPVGRAPRSPRKMSEVIMHVAQPLLDEQCHTPEDIERILGLVIAAWNLTLLPEEVRNKWRDDLLKGVYGRKLFGVVPLGVPRVARHMFQWIYEVVAQRKEELYPHVNHFITGFDVTPMRHGVGLNVAYALEQPQAERFLD